MHNGSAAHRQGSPASWQRDLVDVLILAAALLAAALFLLN